MDVNRENDMGEVYMSIWDMASEPTNKFGDSEIVLCSFENQIVNEEEQEKIQNDIDESLIEEKEQEALNRLKQSDFNFIIE